MGVGGGDGTDGEEGEVGGCWALAVRMVLLVRKERWGDGEMGRLRGQTLLLAISMEIAENGLVITLRRKSVEWETILTFSVLAFLKHRQDT